MKWDWAVMIITALMIVATLVSAGAQLWSFFN